MRGFFLLLVLLFSVHVGMAQKELRHHLGFGLGVGHSFPDFSDQNIWKGSFYPVGSLSMLYQKRFNSSWQGELGGGLSLYALFNKSEYGSYVFDLATPHLHSALKYLHQKNSKTWVFCQSSWGVQLAHIKPIRDRETDYTVLIKNDKVLHFYSLLKVGLRKKLRKTLDKSKEKVILEYGTYFKYMYQDLGTAQFIHSAQIVTTSPSGNSIGVFMNYMLPVGKSKFSQTPTKRLKSRNKSDNRKTKYKYHSRSPRTL